MHRNTRKKSRTMKYTHNHNHNHKKTLSSKKTRGGTYAKNIKSIGKSLIKTVKPVLDVATDIGKEVSKKQIIDYVNRPNISKYKHSVSQYKKNNSPSFKPTFGSPSLGKSVKRDIFSMNNKNDSTPIATPNKSTPIIPMTPEKRKKTLEGSVLLHNTELHNLKRKLSL